MSNPDVTIVVPCYHSEKTIQRCIESIRAQNFENWIALFIVDGWKDDRTVDIIKEYMADDKRMDVIIGERKSTPAEARNIGISKAKTRYICFLDSDDEYLSDHLETHLATMEKYPEFDWCDSWCIQKFPDGSGRVMKHSKCPQTWMIRKTALHMLWRSDGFAFNPYMDRMDDFDFYIRLRKLYGDPIRIEKPTAVYYCGIGVTGTTPLWQQLGIVREIVFRNKAYGCLPWLAKIHLLALPVWLKKKVVG